MAQKGDDASVAYGLERLLLKLEGLSPSTFPGDAARAQSESEWERTNYAEQCRFLAVVRECVNMLYVSSGGIRFRYDRTWGQTARLMQAKMQPLLREVCAFKCSHNVHCKDIHRIRELVDGICEWQAEAVAEKEAAEAEAEAAEAEEFQVMYVPVKAFDTVTVVTEAEKDGDTGVTNGGTWTRTEGVKEGPLRSTSIELIPASREKLRKLVEDMRKNLYTLKKEVEKFDKDLLFCITYVETYQKSCCGDKTWIWNAKEWRTARNRLQICVGSWTKEIKRAVALHGRKEAMDLWWPRLKKYCDQCVRDMERYKQLCERSSTRDDATYPARFRRYWNLECKLEALKTLA